MQTLSEIRELLAERGLSPRKRLGQHFLHDKNQIARLVEAARIEPDELVVEVGPGTGTLTEALLEAGAEVIACEIDEGLASIIEDRLGKRLTLLRGDCLDRRRALNPALVEAIGDRPFKLVANLPYQVASPLLCAILIEQRPCRGQYVTVQKEVADRLLAAPGVKDYGSLTVAVQALARVRRIAVLKPTCFWPQPEVNSAMICVCPRPSPGVEDPADFARFLSDLFSARRKQLGTILGRGGPWPAGVSAELRPEALSVEQLIALWRRDR